MKRPCDDCANLKTTLTRCALCDRRLCNYCYTHRHNLPKKLASGKEGKRRTCLPVETANLFILAGVK
jgi:hypothetical protein